MIDFLYLIDENLSHPAHHVHPTLYMPVEGFFFIKEPVMAVREPSFLPQNVR